MVREEQLGCFKLDTVKYKGNNGSPEPKAIIVLLDKKVPVWHIINKDLFLGARRG